jgi:hypothetical protein
VPHDVKIYPGVGHRFMNDPSDLATARLRTRESRTPAPTVLEARHPSTSTI